MANSTCCPSVQEIKLEHYYKTMTIGDFAYVSATALPTNAVNKQLRWKSDDRSIVIVNTQTGLVRAKKAGKTTITVSTTDDSCIMKKCTITVKDACSYRTTPFWLYISPSNQSSNKYASHPEWTEKKNMELIGDYLKQYLCDYNVNVYLDKVDRRGDTGGYAYKGRPEEAERWIGSNKSNSLYLALHSNGSNGEHDKVTGYQKNPVWGPLVDYTPYDGSAYDLAKKLENAIVSILPSGSSWRRENPHIAQIDNSVDRPKEVLALYDKDIPCILIEVDFHDYQYAYPFLITGQKQIAEAIGNTLVNSIGFAPKQ